MNPEFVKIPVEFVIAPRSEQDILYRPEMMNKEVRVLNSRAVLARIVCGRKNSYFTAYKIGDFGNIANSNHRSYAKAEAALIKYFGFPKDTVIEWRQL